MPQLKSVVKLLLGQARLVSDELARGARPGGHGIHAGDSACRPALTHRTVGRGCTPFPFKLPYVPTLFCMNLSAYCSEEALDELTAIEAIYGEDAVAADPECGTVSVTLESGPAVMTAGFLLGPSYPSQEAPIVELESAQIDPSCFASWVQELGTLFQPGTLLAVMVVAAGGMWQARVPWCCHRGVGERMHGRRPSSEGRWMQSAGAPCPFAGPDSPPRANQANRCCTPGWRRCGPNWKHGPKRMPWPQCRSRRVAARPQSRSRRKQAALEPAARIGPGAPPPPSRRSQWTMRGSSKSFKLFMASPLRRKSRHSRRTWPLCRVWKRCAGGMPCGRYAFGVGFRAHASGTPRFPPPPTAHAHNVSCCAGGSLHGIPADQTQNCTCHTQHDGSPFGFLEGAPWWAVRGMPSTRAVFLWGGGPCTPAPLNTHMHSALQAAGVPVPAAQWSRGPGLR